jgi:hypothetical protein
MEIALSRCRGVVRWRSLAFAGVRWRSLAFAGVRWRSLAFGARMVYAI